MKKDKNYISIVANIDNLEEDCLTYLIFLKRNLLDFCINYQVILLYSKNLNSEILKKNAKESKLKNISIIKMQNLEQKHTLSTVGVEYSIGDFVIEIEYPTSETSIETLKGMYIKCIEGNDVVSLRIIHKNIHYKVLNYFLSKSKVLKSCFETDLIRVVSRRAINRVLSLYKNLEYRNFAYYNCGLKFHIIELPSFKNTKNNKMENISFIFKSLNSLFLFSRIFLRISIFLTAVFMLILFSIVSFVVYLYFFEKPIEGWTSQILLISFSFMFSFFILTIILKYLNLILKYTSGLNFNLIEKIDTF